MRPTLVDRVRSPSGALRYERHNEPLSRAFSERTAAAVTEMMKHVVETGTGTAAQIPGVQIAGKTGTAQTGVNGQLDAWFIAFAPGRRAAGRGRRGRRAHARVRRRGRRADRPRRSCRRC